MIKYTFFPNVVPENSRSVNALLAKKSREEALQSFFEVEEVKEAVDKKDWQRVFEIWVEPHKPLGKLRADTNKYVYTYEDYRCNILALFLYFLGIDFMPSLRNSFIEELMDSDIDYGFDPNNIIAVEK